MSYVITNVFCLILKQCFRKYLTIRFLYEDAKVRPLEEINEEIEAFSSEESTDNDATDGVFDFLRIYRILYR